jgi:hypothetical protein
VSVLDAGQNGAGMTIHENIAAPAWFSPGSGLHPLDHRTPDAGYIHSGMTFIAMPECIFGDSSGQAALFGSY